MVSASETMSSSGRHTTARTHLANATRGCNHHSTVAWASPWRARETTSLPQRTVLLEWRSSRTWCFVVTCLALDNTCGCSPRTTADHVTTHRRGLLREGTHLIHFSCTMYQDLNDRRVARQLFCGFNTDGCVGQHAQLLAQRRSAQAPHHWHTPMGTTHRCCQCQQGRGQPAFARDPTLSQYTR